MLTFNWRLASSQFFLATLNPRREKAFGKSKDRSILGPLALQAITLNLWAVVPGANFLFLYSGTPEGAGLTLEVISISKSAQQEDKVELFLCLKSSEDRAYQGTFQVPPLLTGCQKNENYDENLDEN